MPRASGLSGSSSDSESRPGGAAAAAAATGGVFPAAAAAAAPRRSHRQHRDGHGLRVRVTFKSLSSPGRPAAAAGPRSE
jgi:hypothetical protein